MACHSFVEATHFATFVPVPVGTSMRFLVPVGTNGSSPSRLKRPPRLVHAFG